MRFLRPALGIGAALAVHVALVAQTTTLPDYYVDDPSNWDCSTALRICEDTRFIFNNSDHGPGCLFFYFIPAPGSAVNITATTTEPDEAVSFFATALPETLLCQYAQLLTCPEGSASGTDQETANNGGAIFLLWNPGEDGNGVLEIDLKEPLAPCGLEDCCYCLPSFRPDPGKEYLVSAWCQLMGASPELSSYANGPDGPTLVVTSPSTSFSLTIEPSGPIIDGWQRMEKIFTIDALATDLEIELHCDNCSALFDDVRFAPRLSSMKCSVYDPWTLRLDAELDDRHFATFYEYDGEGKLTRIKKETERGIMTIQETRYNTSKRFVP